MLSTSITQIAYAEDMLKSIFSSYFQFSYFQNNASSTYAYAQHKPNIFPQMFNIRLIFYAHAQFLMAR